MDKLRSWLDSAHYRHQTTILYDVLVVGLSNTTAAQIPVAGKIWNSFPLSLHDQACHEQTNVTVEFYILER